MLFSAIETLAWQFPFEYADYYASLRQKSYFRKFLQKIPRDSYEIVGSFWHVRTKKSRNLEKEPYVPSVQGMKYHWQPSMEDFRSGKVMEVFTLFQAQPMSFKFPAPDLLVGLETEPQENWTSVDLTYTFPPLLDSFFLPNNLYGKFFTIYYESNPDRIIGILKKVQAEGGIAPPYDCMVRSRSDGDEVRGLSARHLLMG